MRLSQALAVVLLISGSADAQRLSRIVGVVTDVSGHPLEGASISIVERPTAPPVVAGADGAFEIADLPAGRYSITATLSGFRPETRNVVLRESGSAPRLTFALRVGVLIEAMVVMAEPREALRRADAIARVRLEGLAPLLPCAELTVVSLVHNVSVLEVMKGSVPERIQVLEYNRGGCTDGSQPVTALGGSPSRYSSASEYIVFLTKAGKRFDGLGPSEYVFPVRDGVVSTEGFLGLPPTMDLAAFRAALARLRRER